MGEFSGGQSLRSFSGDRSNSRLRGILLKYHPFIALTRVKGIVLPKAEDVNRYTI
jgi:hypothetical protein